MKMDSSTKKRICVFCGSSPGAHEAYVHTARLLGRVIAERSMTLVYGGAQVGVMGQLAGACLDAGGDVVGVITKRLVEMEVAHRGLTELIVVDSMHERKAKMAELADGFIALPGGLGTIEEFFEVLTWAQLGIHHKPCGLLNTRRYYDPLLAFLKHAVDQQFVEPVHTGMIQVDETIEGLLEKFATYRPPTANKAEWVRRLSEPMLEA
jgi:uncharacterized protein (TIGR00730 family)